MANNWTNDQLEAINSVTKGTVVSAAAGSGKTAVLVERTIRMLSDPTLGIEADRLLAVTFTNDAANQMKEKLSTAMGKMLSENPENEWISKQQELLSMASICTIDSFCMDLVKSNIQEFDISGSFAMIDGEEHDVLLKNAFDDAAVWYYKNLPEKMQILMDNFAEEDDSEVIKYANLLLKFKGSLPFPEQWKKKVLSNLDALINNYNQTVAKEYFGYLTALRGCGDAVKKSAEKLELDEKYRPLYMSYYELCEIMKRLPVDVALKSDAFAQTEKMKFPARSKAKSLTAEKNEAYDTVDAVKKSHKEVFKAIRALDFIPSDVKKETVEKTTLVFETLWDFVKKAEEILWDFKLERNKLHFSDITRLTIKLLAKETDDGYVKSEFSESITAEKRYKIILIDEFQDVNNLQDVIFKCISDTDDTEILGTNTFVVGDMKQSIYRFRQSNPAIFNKARNIAGYDENKDKAKAIYLKKNFRSRKNILDFTNFIFENVMSEQVGEVTYDENERLELGADYKGDNFNTNVMLLERDFSDDDEDESEIESDTIHFECKAVANEIKSMLEKKVQVFDGGKLRPCRAGDFCVLLRTGKMVNEYIKAFESVNLKAVSDSVKGYLGAREINLALSMLRIIDNPMQDIPLVAVSLSAVFGFTPDELAKIRIIDKYKKFYQLFLAVARDEKASDYGFDAVEIDDKAIVAKCANAVSVISKLRFYASGMSLEKLVRKVYDETDLMSVAASYENSDQKRANLRLLVKLAEDYESSVGGGLSDFLRYLDRVVESGNDFEEALTVSAGNDTVNIKTIHKSKGLEYPFVVVGDLAREYNIPKMSDKLILNEVHGIGMTLRNNLPKCNSRTYFYDYVFEKNILEQKSEELRILYVALTRAKEKLILPLYLKTKALGRIKKAAANLFENAKPSPDDIGKLLSYAEIIAYALLRHPDRQELCDYLGIEADPQLSLGGEADVEFRKVCVNENSLVKNNTFIKAPLDRGLFDRLVNNVLFKEDNPDLETVAKMSVTEFVREFEEGSAEKEITYFPPIPDVSKPERKSTAAQKGTYTHLFMELCDFEKAAADPEGELQTLVKARKMTAKQASDVDTLTVKAFFESELFSLCKTSANVMREKEFKVKLSDMKLDRTPLEQYNDKDVIVQGIADLIIETDDGLVVVDYKTDNVNEPAELVSRYSVQLLLYKKAFELVLSKPVKDCFVYSFKLKRAVKLDL